MTDMPDNRRALTTSNGIATGFGMQALLGRPIKRGLKGAREGDVIVGWGQKDNTEAARNYAKKHELEYWRLEDGFLGYLSHPSRDKRRLSLVVDHTGIYYDAHTPSDLEALLNRDDWVTPELLSRARAAMARIRKWRLSKYNHAPFDLPPALEAKLSTFKGPKVLLVDQTFGDKSITYGMASDAMFADMLKAALEENPTSLVLVKIHPDVLAGKKQGHFDIERQHDRVLFVADDVAPLALIERVDHVYVVTSQMGLEGLIAGKKVSCFGLPFYAGWGLTHDRQLCEARIANRTLEELFAAAFIVYSRYVDPFSGERVEMERIIDLLVAERQMRRPRGKRAVAVGFSFWKRKFVGRFFGPAAGPVTHIKAADIGKFTFEDTDCVLSWGRKNDLRLDDVPDHIPVWHLEDGFLRSVGLGADLRRPSSLVLDRRGIYYDATSPSDLEHFLAHHSFDEAELARGAALRQAILASRVSKYNVGERGTLDFRTRAGGRKVILVPGQVEGDASLAYGSPDMMSNTALLEAVRANNADAYIVFKPHPDVVTGNREGAVSAAVLDDCANETIVTADIIDCIEAVDEVHVMTSLTGFEALIRGVAVTCYGMPFYSGWGLTTDRLGTPERRGRRLPLDGLVYGLLCVYGRYVSWPEGLSTSPEAIVDAIAREAAATGGKKPSRISSLFRKLRFLIEALIR
ncbi:capsular polysaccharide biosynthesis protein [Kordiimonas gwangyangensis]|uniref:capsular polysaccharide biosynthesis protein n=2 Tax=Kordiimonas gwangyangensis TaxID=288022 RepID=UPI00036E094A|nr:capsular polysaccharide biosynthesis protein [Kordiimonas gwangyangensis]